jgi:hypothetical protein
VRSALSATSVHVHIIFRVPGSQCRTAVARAGRRHPRVHKKCANTCTRGTDGMQHSELSV